MPIYTYLEYHCSLFRRLRVAKLVHGVLLLYLVSPALLWNASYIEY